MRARPSALVMTLAIGAAALAGPPVRAQATAEQATKAAMVYNFTRFADWTSDRFAGPADPVVLCISPTAPLAEAMRGLNGQPVGSRTLTVRLTSRFDHGCHVAYVEDATASQLMELRMRGVLTVGEGPGFLDSGAIQVVTIGRQIRFAINQENASKAGVRLSSNLLRLAVAVR